MIPEQPTDWTCGPKAMLRQVALRKLIDAGTPEFDTEKLRRALADRHRFDPRKPLTGFALRLFRASNAFHECRSETID